MRIVAFRSAKVRTGTRQSSDACCNTRKSDDFRYERYFRGAKGDYPHPIRIHASDYVPNGPGADFGETPCMLSYSP